MSAATAPGVTLLNAATSASAPSAATDGAAIPSVLSGDLVLSNPAGTGTPTASKYRLWGYHTLSAKWVPMSTGAGSLSSNAQGLLNGGDGLEACASNTLRLYERVENLRAFSRLAVEIVTAPGGSYTVDVHFFPHMDYGATTGVR